MRQPFRLRGSPQRRSGATAAGAWARRADEKTVPIPQQQSEPLADDENTAVRDVDMNADDVRIQMNSVQTKMHGVFNNENLESNLENVLSYLVHDENKTE